MEIAFQLTTEAAEKAAQLVLEQLSKRLCISKQQTKVDDEMECLQFGICSYQNQAGLNINLEKIL